MTGPEKNGTTQFWMRGKIPLGVDWRGVDTPRSVTLQWYQSDSQKGYKPQGNRYGPEDIQYTFNTHGYRSMEIDPASPARKIMFVGCSFTQGIALPLEHVWTSRLTALVAQQLGCQVEQHNFGMGGYGDDAFAMIVTQVLPLLKPDLLMVLSTSPTRRAYHPDFDQRVPFLPHMGSHGLKAQHRAYLRLQSDAQDLYEWCRNHNLMHSVARLHGVPWAWQHGDAADFPVALDPYADLSNRMPRSLRDVAQGDLARDMMHVGPDTHKAFAEMAMEFLMSGGYLEWSAR